MLEILSSLGSMLANPAISTLSVPEIVRATPGAKPATASESILIEAAQRRAEKLVPGSNLEYYIHKNSPLPNTSQENMVKNFQGMIRNAAHLQPENFDQMQQMLNLPDAAKGKDVVLINPNSDESLLAHELGHGVSAKSKVGKQVRNLRNNINGNPRLGLAISLAGIMGSGANAVFSEGDDDLATSAALAYAGFTPTLVDEALATKNGLAIMKDAGRRASLGQRARLAGAYLTYASLPLAAAVVPNKVGNIFDKDSEAIA